MNRTIAHRIHPTTLATLVGGQKLNGGQRLQRRRNGVCDTLTTLHIRDAFKERGVRIMPKTAASLLALVMNGEKVTYRGVRIHADRRRNNLFAYRI